MSVQVGSSSTSMPGLKHSDIVSLTCLCAAAFMLRLVPVVVHPSLDWGDEVYQTTEQAHRLVYGTGLIPWEFQVGMRSWLLPGFIAGIMAAARLIGPGAHAYLPAIAGVLGLLSLAPMVCTYFWCRRRGAAPALLAALVAGTAPELIYFSDRALAEVVAAHLLVVAMYALQSDGPAPAARRVALGGAALGLVVALRLQLAPAAALVLLIAMRRGRLWPLLAGAVAVMLAAGMLDAITLGAPFASMWRNFQYNIVQHASVSFGVQPWYYYGLAELAVWGGLILVPLVLCAAGLRIGWLPAAVAVLIIVTHSCLGHKEHRFIYPALVLLAVQAGCGLASLSATLTDFFHHEPLPRAVVSAGLGAVWCVVAVVVWQAPGMAALRARAHDQLAAAHYAASAPAVCGIGMYGPGPDAWAPYGGYTHLQHDVPLYWPAEPAAFATYEDSFNMLLTGVTPPDATFRREACFGTICAFRRLGNCTPQTMMRMPFPAGIAVP